MRTIIQERIEGSVYYFFWSIRMGQFPLAYIINLGWLRIGPPYIYLNIDPVILHLGPLALRWYGLMYVVGIVIGLSIIRGYTDRKGINQDMVYRILWWCIVAGLIGGRLYFVIQQPNLVDYYLKNPIHIIATWEGGMAFYGAIFLVIPTLIWRARVERINPLVLIDAGVLFAAAGQIFGRIGNIINGDIIGYPSTLPWSTVYQNTASWACLRPETCNVPVQPAAGYELLTNLVLLGVMLYLAKRVRRPGVLMLVYLYTYAITQFLIFYTRANDIVTFLGLNWGLKQAQWTSLVVFIALLPLTYWLIRYSKPVPRGENAATYGLVPRKSAAVVGTVTKIVDVTDQSKDKKSTPVIKDEKPLVIPKHEVEILPDEPTEELPGKQDIADATTVEVPPDKHKAAADIADASTIEIPSDDVTDVPTIEIPPDNEESKEGEEKSADDVSDVPTIEMVPNAEDTSEDSKGDVDNSEDEKPEVIIPEEETEEADKTDEEDGKKVEKKEEVIDGEVKEVSSEETKVSSKKSK
jgi:phosphatidylglycerol:prolipoprotein diacylglycerol transferase